MVYILYPNCFEGFCRKEISNDCPAFDVTIKQHKEIKGLKKENLLQRGELMQSWADFYFSKVKGTGYE